MILLRAGALCLLLGVVGCAPTSQNDVLSSDWLAENRISVDRPMGFRDGEFRSGRYDGRLAGGADRPVSHRMLTRDADGVRPLSVTFVGPDTGLPQGIGEPRIVPAAASLQCVPFARELSGIAMRGNAWTWWDQAEGQFRRSDRPEVGAIMVLSKTRQLPLGHLAVVTEVLGDRQVIVSHANWLNKGQIHLDTPVVDVSPKNDWSVIRAWYTPGQTMGLNAYAVSGFILPDPIQSADSGS